MRLATKDALRSSEVNDAHDIEGSYRDGDTRHCNGILGWNGALYEALDYEVSKHKTDGCLVGCHE